MVRTLVRKGAMAVCGVCVCIGSLQAGTLSVVSSSPEANALTVVNGSPVAANTNLVLPGNEDVINYFALTVPTNNVPPNISGIPPVLTEPPIVSRPSFPPPSPAFPMLKGVPLSRKAAGTYFGIILQEGSDRTGSVRLTVNRSGRGTATVSLDDEPRRSISIQVDQEGNIATQGSASQEVTLSGKLDVVDGLNGFGAEITAGSESIPVHMVNARAAAAVTTELKGKYTLVIRNNSSSVPLQQGVAGFGTLAVSKFGLIRFAGKLSDNANFSQATALTVTGQWKLASTANTGSKLAGIISFAATASSDLSGTPTLRIRFPGPIVNQPPGEPVSLVGSKFNPALGFAAPQFRFIAETGFSQDVNTTVVAQNLLKLVSTGSDKTRLNLNASSGVISGTFRASSGLPLNASGVVFQKTLQGFGLTKQPPRTSSRDVRIEPRAIVGGFPFTGHFSLGQGAGAAQSSVQ